MILVISTTIDCGRTSTKKLCKYELSDFHPIGYKLLKATFVSNRTHDKLMACFLLTCILFNLEKAVSVKLTSETEKRFQSERQ